MLLLGKKGIKFFSAALSCLILGFNFSSPILAGNIDIQKSEKEKLQRQKQEFEKEFRNAKKDIQAETNVKNNLDKQISSVENQIDRINESIDELNREINRNEKEIKQINEEMKEKVQTLKSMLRSLYKAGDVGTIDIVLGAKDFEDFLDKADIVRSISKTVRKIIDELKEKLRCVKEKEKQIIKVKNQKEKEAQKLSKNQKDLQVLVDKSEQSIKKLEDSAAQVKHHMDENDAAIKAVDDKIRKYYEEQKRLAEANKNSKNPPIVHKGGFIWPAPGFTHITTQFGAVDGVHSTPHGGIDIAGGAGKGSIYGANIVAAASGRVVFVNTDGYGGGGYGKFIMIDHGNGISTLYAHLSSVLVSPGQTVSQGQVIGRAGSTGRSTGPHLHFEYRVYGERKNPRIILSY